MNYFNFHNPLTLNLHISKLSQREVKKLARSSSLVTADLGSGSPIAVGMQSFLSGSLSRLFWLSLRPSLMSCSRDNLLLTSAARAKYKDSLISLTVMGLYSEQGIVLDK